MHTWADPAETRRQQHAYDSRARPQTVKLAFFPGFLWILTISDDLRRIPNFFVPFPSLFSGGIYVRRRRRGGTHNVGPVLVLVTGAVSWYSVGAVSLYSIGVVSLYSKRRAFWARPGWAMAMDGP